MTVTVEAHHGSLVDVRVLERKQNGDAYARKILLAKQTDGKIVQFGLVRIWLPYCSPEVRDEILSQKTPIGRILINHNVLRRIEPTEFLRVTPGPDMMQWFGLTKPDITYGRLAIIHCDEQPAVAIARHHLQDQEIAAGRRPPPPGTQKVPKVRVFLDFLVERFRPQPS